MIQWILRLFGAGKTSFENLKHCKVAEEWKSIRDAAWNNASTVLRSKGHKIVTKVKKITIQAGIKTNPSTNQWGAMTYIGGKEFWYAGLCAGSNLKIVGTPEKKPYAKSLAIFTHEAAESILDQDREWRVKSADERNKYLWSLGL